MRSLALMAMPLLLTTPSRWITHTSSLLHIPNPPQTTIRTILNNIKAISPEFSVEIVHPITLEERSKQMAAAERKKILYRAIFSVVAAIPTFILGIVGMSLLPKTNSFRVYLDEPLWVGSVSELLGLCLSFPHLFTFTQQTSFIPRPTKRLQVFGVLVRHGGVDYLNLAP